MLIALCAQTVALIAVAVLLTRSRAQAEADWSRERRELLNRIQAPERAPYLPTVPIEVPDPEPDHTNLVGTIQQEPEE